MKIKKVVENVRAAKGKEIKKRKMVARRRLAGMTGREGKQVTGVRKEKNLLGVKKIHKDQSTDKKK